MTSFWVILTGGLSLLAGSGLALGASLGLTGLILLHFVADGITFVAVDAVWNVLNSFTLSAIPLFIILGEIMLRSEVSKKNLNHFSTCACHPCAGAMLIFSVSFQF